MRGHNEDAFLVGSAASWECGDSAQQRDAGEEPLLLMVCDGMGGAAAGEVASRLAVETVRKSFRTRRRRGRRGLPERLEAALHEANRAVHDGSTSVPGQSGMGATATALLLSDDRAHLAQIGDSRAYLMRCGVLQHITRDQSLVGMLVEAEQITPEAARTHPGQNVLLQALGPRATVTPAITTLVLRRGDRLLLCSDGLSGCLGDAEMQDVLERHPDVGDAVEELIRLALARGADDNVTAVLAEADGRRLAAPTGGPVELDCVKIYRPGEPEPPTPHRKGWVRRVLAHFRRSPVSETRS